MIVFVTMALTLLQAPVTSSATPAPKDITLDAQLQGLFSRSRGLLIRTAERMPADAYSFRPSPDVRTFGDSVVHTAATAFAMCANLTGTPSPKDPKALEQTSLTKDEAVKLLTEAFDYCDGYVKGLTAAQLGATYPATLIGRDGQKSPVTLTKAGLLGTLIAHNNEMYGYMAVYLRLKGLVPPSSDPPVKKAP